jgi:hypothetical protein
MEVPLLQEIREARSLSEQASAAQSDLTQIGSVLQSLQVVALQSRARPHLQLDLPGSELVLDLRARWPYPDEDSSLSFDARLDQRSANLRGLTQILQPMANVAVTCAQRLANLQHRQQHLLAAPEFSELVAKMQAVGREREALQSSMLPIQQQESRIKPAAATVATLLVDLTSQLSRRDEPDPRGLVAFRAVHVAAGIVGALRAAVVGLTLEIRLPDLLLVPVQPDPERCADHWATLNELREELQQLQSILDQRRDEAVRTAEQARTRYESVLEQIKKVLG